MPRGRRNATPGPGSYDLGGMGRWASSVKKSGPKVCLGPSYVTLMGDDAAQSLRHPPSLAQFSFGSANRWYSPGGIGTHSPGPATYNTRGREMETEMATRSLLVCSHICLSSRWPSHAGPVTVGAGSFGSDQNRPNARSAASPGPVYYPQVGSSKQAAPSYSMGSGHSFGDNTSVISPGPVYDTRERPGQGSGIVSGLPTFKFGTAGARTDYSKGGAFPGPGHYSPTTANKKRPPRFTMYESYSWRRGKSTPLHRTPPPAGSKPIHGRCRPYALRS
jgi:hypothetical protein